MSAIISRMRIPKGLKFNKKGDVKSSMTLPWVQGASHVLSECSDAGPSYSVESVESRMGSEKLIPSPPRVEDILDWEWVNTKFKSDIAPQSQKMILSDTPLMSLVPYYCDVVKCSMKEAPLLLAPHQTPINEAQAELISRMSPYVYVTICDTRSGNRSCDWTGDLSPTFSEFVYVCLCLFTYVWSLDLFWKLYIDPTLRDLLPLASLSTSIPSY